MKKELSAGSRGVGEGGRGTNSRQQRLAGRSRGTDVSQDWVDILCSYVTWAGSSSVKGIS